MGWHLPNARNTRRQGVSAPVATAVALGIVALTGCDAGTASSPGATFCEQWLAAVAEFRHRCTGASRDALLAAFGAIDACGPIGASLDAERLAFNPGRADDCLAEVDALECWQNPLAAPACQLTLTGRVPAGGSCYRLPLGQAECAAGSHCRSDEGHCPGVCIGYAQLGDACGSCTPSTPDWCGREEVECDPSLQCGHPEGTCVETAHSEPGIGDACAGVGHCAQGLVCEGQDGPLHRLGAGTCEPPPSSGPCFSNWECSNRCTGGELPDAPGECVAWRALGERCTPGARECVPGAYCGDAAACVPLPGVGEKCTGNAGEGQECVNGFCDASGNCRPLLDAGDACTAPERSGWFDIGLDPCGGLVLECVAGFCRPTCMFGRTCGKTGEVCCAEGGGCDAGNACIAGKCERCGGEGEPCCPTCPGPSCDSATDSAAPCRDGGCCNAERTCVPEGSACGSGTCDASSCGGCGAPGEACCGPPVPGAPWCSSAAVCTCMGNLMSSPICTCVQVGRVTGGPGAP
jgi:hypothetical protein